jgi:hypothetical protein
VTVFSVRWGRWDSIFCGGDARLARVWPEIIESYFCQFVQYVLHHHEVGFSIVTNGRPRKRNNLFINSYSPRFHWRSFTFLNVSSFVTRIASILGGYILKLMFQSIIVSSTWAAPQTTISDTSRASRAVKHDKRLDLDAAASSSQASRNPSHPRAIMDFSKRKKWRRCFCWYAATQKYFKSCWPRKRYDEPYCKMKRIKRKRYKVEEEEREDVPWLMLR